MEESVKKSFIEEHPRSIFWIRFALWVICAAGLPFLFIAFRYDIFKNVSNVSLSGWGIIAVIIIAIFALSLIKYIKKGFKSKSVFFTQCVNGFSRIIVPLVVIYAVIKININNLQAFMEALGCTILCEAVAIPLNPMPQWVDECKKEDKESENKDAIDYLTEKVFAKKEK